MTLTEHKSRTHHYFTDETNNMHGLFQSWYIGGHPVESSFHVHGKYHGECKRLFSDGKISGHCIYVNEEIVMDLEQHPPLTEEDKFALCLEYGHMEFLPQEQS